jgi:uncharacterized iron-regulated protein
MALAACATGQSPIAQATAPPPALSAETRAEVFALKELLPTEVLLLGEQHDAPAHQQRQREVLDALLARDRLAGLVIEMASQGTDTAKLASDATETQVRQALRWTDSAAAGWEWSVYGPLVMRAVRAGVLVWGGNLPREDLSKAMQDAALDGLLSPGAWASLQTQIREGHCNMLPESQVAPMTRVQVARDLAMARTAQRAMKAGKTVMLVAGNQHVRRDLGVPWHLGAQVRSTSILMIAGPAAQAGEITAADRTWHTEPLPEQDHCAVFKARMKAR